MSRWVSFWMIRNGKGQQSWVWAYKGSREGAVGEAACAPSFFESCSRTSGSPARRVRAQVSKLLFFFPPCVSREAGCSLSDARHNPDRGGQCLGCSMLKPEVYVRYAGDIKVYAVLAGGRLWLGNQVGCPGILGTELEPWKNVSQLGGKKVAQQLKWWEVLSLRTWDLHASNSCEMPWCLGKVVIPDLRGSVLLTVQILPKQTTATTWRWSLPFRTSLLCGLRLEL